MERSTVSKSMNILNHASSVYEGWRRRRTLLALRSADPDALVRWAESRLIPAFHRVAAGVPFYARLLESQGVDPHGIRGLEEFKECVPILDKRSTFRDQPIDQLCMDGSLKGVKSLLTSSGHSGVFAFGVQTQRDLTQARRAADVGLEYAFEISRRKSLLINALPMGVKVETSLPLAETSVRQEMVWAVIRKFSPYFEQMILLGEGSFLKKVIEEGREQGIDWGSRIFHFVSGEEGIAESLRTYVGGLLGLDFASPHGGMFCSSMGVGELGLNLFHETRGTIMIRRLAQNRPELREALFGKGIKVCPMLFVYYPHRSFVEEIACGEEVPELAVSMVDPGLKIPLLRYKPGDRGRVLSYRRVQDILRQFDLEPWMPDLRLPMVAVYGRGHGLGTGARRVTPEALKEALYEDPVVAASVTGAFKLRQDGEEIHMDVQLRKGWKRADDLPRRLQKCLAEWGAMPVHSTLYPYAEFPFFMELDYERKFSYV